MISFNVKKRLEEIHWREGSILTGNATVGIYLALKAMGIFNGVVAVPNSICINVPLAILYSGNIPLFLDISERTLGLSIESLQAYESKIDVVIANHSYGSVCDIESISLYCKSKGIKLIEDFSVAQGAVYRNKPVGSFGDLSVVSFGAGKIVSIGDCGAVLSNDKSLIKEIENLSEDLPNFNEENEKGIKELNTSYKHHYNNFFGKPDWNELNIFSLSKKSKNLFFYKYREEFSIELELKLESLPDIILKRNEKAELFMEIFTENKNENISFHIPLSGSVFWRFNLFVKNKRHFILKELLKNKYMVSSWYPSANPLFIPDSIAVETPNSDLLSDQILNLWISSDVNFDYVDSIAKEILKLV